VGTISPNSPTSDGFYPTGQQLTMNATPYPGWTFAGWTYDLTGTANPATLAANDETLVFANFNIVATPLTLTSMSPTFANAGGSDFTLTLTGTGFSPDSLVSVNGQFRTVTYISSTELQVPLTADDIASPAAFQVFVDNFPAGWDGCAVFGYQTFLVKAPLLTSQSINFAAITGTQTALTNIDLTATATSGLPVAFESTTPAVCTVSGTTASLVASGQCGIAAVQVGNETYAPATPVPHSFLVHQAAQTVTFAPIASQVVGAPLALSATASSGLAVTFDSTTPAICTVAGSTASMIAKGDCNIQARQAGSPVYLSALVNRGFLVTLPTQTIDFPAITGTQTALSNIGLSATATSGLAVTYTSLTPAVCTVSGSTASLLISGNCSVQASQAGSASFAPASPVNQTFRVSQVAQTITFNAIPSQIVGAQLSLSATASSGLAVTLASTTPSVCTVSGTTASMIATGNCNIQARQAGSPVYLSAVVNRSFIVTLHSQTIGFPAITGTQTALSNINLSATATSSLTVSFSSLTPVVCTVSGNTASLLISGLCTLRASQPGNTTYNAAPQVTQTFRVSQVAQTITFAAFPSQFVGAHLSLSATATSGLAVTFDSTTLSVCTVTGNTASVIAAGSCNLQARQSGSPAYLAAPTINRSFIVVLPTQTITFPAIPGGQTALSNITLSATATSGLPVTFSSLTPVVCTVSGNTASLLISGNCSLRASQSGNASFAPAPSATQTIRVGQIAQTITFPAIPSQVVGAQLNLSGTASSGLAVTFDSTTPAVCTVSGNTASVIATGSCNLQAKQPGSPVYLAAPTINRSFIATR
jgi:hypothetical protein